MNTVRRKIDPKDPASLSAAWINHAGVDSTTEEDITRRVRKRLKLGQAKLLQRIGSQSIQSATGSKANAVRLEQPKRFSMCLIRPLK